MKTKKYFLVLLFFSVLTSCTSNEFQTDLQKKMVQKSETLKNKVSVEKEDSIIPLVGERNHRIRITNTRAIDDGDEALKEELEQLNEIPIYLQVQGNSSDKQFLNATNKGKELTVENFKGNSLNQQFYLKILPASVGIPYLIYSKATGTPIRIGAYKKHPEIKVLYASNDDDTSSLFGASWNIKRAQYSSSAYIIENQDYPQQGSSGIWSDIYYYAITVNDSKISFAKYNKLPQQEFAIVPVENFKIESITFNQDASATLSKTPQVIFSDRYTNNGPIKQNHTFEIVDTYKKTSNFSRKTSYNVTVETTVTVKVPFVAKGEIKTTVSEGQEFTYGKSEEHSFTVDRTYPVEVPANYRADMSLTLYKYNMDVEYTATCIGLTSGKRIKIKGRWTGVDVEESDAVLTQTPINGNNNSSRSIIITKDMLRTNKIIKIQ